MCGKNHNNIYIINHCTVLSTAVFLHPCEGWGIQFKGSILFWECFIFVPWSMSTSTRYIFLFGSKDSGSRILTFYSHICYSIGLFYYPSSVHRLLKYLPGEYFHYIRLPLKYAHCFIFCCNVHFLLVPFLLINFYIDTLNLVQFFKKIL